MHTFVQTPKATQQAAPAKYTRLGQAYLGMQHKSDRIEAVSNTTPSGHFGHNFNRIPIFSTDRTSRPLLSLPLAAEPRPAAMQAKLVVGQSNDPLEHEADRIADQVMRMPDPLRTDSGATLQPKCAACEEEARSGTVRTKQHSAFDVSGSEAHAVVDEVLRSAGEPLDASTRAFFEPRFDRDFSQVRVHADDRAARSARSIGALAYAVGPHVIFAEGQYAPGGDRGKHLLAHELAHTIQQDHSHVQRQTDADAGRDAGAAQATCPPAQRLDEIERSYRQMIADARGRGANVAADNLAHFLSGAGGTRVLGVPWLRSFATVIAAERVNQERFERQMNEQANGMAHGDRRDFTDHWSRQFTAGMTEELYYASGTSTIRSTGRFHLERIENIVSISGTVHHHWYDPYDWHAGLGAYIPGHGNVSDADALTLQNCRGSRPFQMEADWDQYLSGTISVGRLWNTKSFSWTGP